MNDFADIESELKKLRPTRASAELLSRIELEMDRGDAMPSAGVMKRVPSFRVNWFALGLGLAAAAMFLVFMRLDIREPSKPTVAQAGAATPAPKVALSNTFVPNGLTQVVYHTRDEGVVFPGNSPEPMRRLRKHSRETLQWRNPQTGASLRVSYPAEQVDLIPISGQ